MPGSLTRSPRWSWSRLEEACSGARDALTDDHPSVLASALAGGPTPKDRDDAEAYYPDPRKAATKLCGPQVLDVCSAGRQEL